VSTEAPPKPRRLLRGLWRQLLAEHAEPERLGVGVAVGVLIGCSPFFGLQTLIALAAASVLKLNKLAVLLGAQISIPPFTPLVIFLGAQSGELLLHGHLLPLTVAQIRHLPASELLRTAVIDLAVGGTLVGAALGLVLGGTTTRIVRRQRAAAGGPRLDEGLLDTLEERAQRLPRRRRSYAWWKVRLDPIYARVLAREANGAAVLDLGAGMGLMAALLALRYPGVKVRAIEWDELKVSQGRVLCEGLDAVTFEPADIFAAALGAPDVVLLLDVLHYTPVAVQRALLERCAVALRPGGTLWVRDLATQSTWAERLERWAVRRGWNRGAGVEAWGAVEIAKTLEAQGLTVATEQSGHGPFRGNALVIGRKQSR
jgi:uncharacterized protein (DUF2062 family)/SAM-dependent methyltransferase